jgi:FAD/FMN-containing dehydrogenase
MNDHSILEPGRTWWNWFGEQYFVPNWTARPRSEEDVRRAVIAARRLELPVRVSGAGHSNPAIVPTPGVHIDFDAFRDVVAVDKQAFQVTIRPGMRVSELSRYLRTQGMSLNNQGDIDTQTVIGAIMTGTHGAGVTLPCFSAQMIAARIVTGDGTFLDLSAKKDGELFRAFRCSIGMFGVVVSLTIQAVPSYNIHKRSWNADVEDCIGGLHRRLNENRTFWFFWLPVKESADLYELPGGSVPSTATRDYDICHMRTYNAVPADAPAPELLAGEQFDHSSVIYPNVYIPNFREIEYAVPFAQFEEAFAEVRAHFQSKYPSARFPVECRPVKADDSLLSAYAERDGYALSISGPLEFETWGMLKEFDEILDRYDARPHWGKHHFMSPARLERIYPHYDRFKQIRQEIDPDGVFLNDHLRALFA